jgi:hypothetical protein
MLLEIAAGAGLLYLLSKSGGLSILTGGPSSGTGGGGSSVGNQPSGSPGQKPPIHWPPNAGEPGYVTLGGSPAPTSLYTGSTAQKIVGVAGAGAGSVLGVAGGIATIEGVQGGASAILGSALVGGLTIGGLVAAPAGIVLALISRHHAQAVANEARALNDAVPTARQVQILIAQAAITGAIQNVQQAKDFANQMIGDFYNSQKGIIRGRWPYTVQRKPDPCNGPCVVGHNWIEGDVFNIVIPTVQKILSGQHGTMTLPKIPSHAGFVGFPEVRMVY